jgi:hypothetical protein
MICTLPNIVRLVKSRRIRWAGHVAVWERIDVCTGCWWESLRKRPLLRPRREWEDNIKMDFQEVGGCRVDWMELAQDGDRMRAFVGMVRDFRFP